MIPNVFVSSTIEDLQHLRDAVRDTLVDMCYTPVMSEYGDVGYIPTASAVDSCFVSVKSCQLAVVFIGKRYGSLWGNDLSVTHNEFDAARTHKVPIICLVDGEVLSFKKVFDAGSPEQSTPKFPGMDSPDKTFRFIQDVMDGSRNNAVLPYKSATEARELLKKQLALMFGELLSSRYDPLKAEIQDVLAEVMTLRHEIGENRESLDRRSLAAFRFLVDDENRAYRQIIERTIGPIDSALSLVLGSETFDDFVGAASIELKINNELEMKLSTVTDDGCSCYNEQLWGSPDPDEKSRVARYGCWRGREVRMNDRAKQMFDWKHEQFRLAVGPGPKRDGEVKVE